MLVEPGLYILINFLFLRVSLREPFFGLRTDHVDAPTLPLRFCPIYAYECLSGSVVDTYCQHREIANSWLSG